MTEEPTAGFAAALRQHTQALHTQAERSGIVNDILRGRASRAGYALLLRNLLPAYEAMEAGLQRHRENPAVAPFAQPGIYRAPAIAADLAALGEPDLPLLPAGVRYAARVAAAAAHDGSGLIAHAYARYLGDLSGGQILKKLLGKSLGLNAGELSFYDFPGIPDHAAFKTAYRAALDACAAHVAEPDALLREAATAFELNIAVSDAVQAEATPQADAAQ